MVMAGDTLRNFFVIRAFAVLFSLRLVRTILAVVQSRTVTCHYDERGAYIKKTSLPDRRLSRQFYLFESDLLPSKK
ncbi:hypothetical protein MNBD_GAMMA12-1473 [hydrothermal vent metagenome]|uniref:Uncharacterized protein n=1 Tax=hydrothermal vent metagenome TaxID=652676 RepID=A0A3B0Y9J5_9ZZZZ